MVQRVPAPPSTSQQGPAPPRPPLSPTWSPQGSPGLPGVDPGLPGLDPGLPGLDPGLRQDCILGCQLGCQDCILGCQDRILGGAASKMRFGTHFGPVLSDKMVPWDLKNH